MSLFFKFRESKVCILDAVREMPRQFGTCGVHVHDTEYVLRSTLSYDEFRIETCAILRCQRASRTSTEHGSFRTVMHKTTRYHSFTGCKLGVNAVNIKHDWSKGETTLRVRRMILVLPSS